MLKPVARRFLYRGHALGVAGNFNLPYSEPLDAQASCSLAVTGGSASAQSLSFRYRNILSFDSAQSQVSGMPTSTAGDFTSSYMVTVKNLNVLNVLTADTIVVRLVSHHYFDGREASLVALGSHIDNLKVAGQPVALDLDGDVLANWDTYSKAASGLAARVPPVLPQGDVICTSIFKTIGPVAGVTAAGNRLDFPEFGSIYLGEIFVKAAQRRLTAIRLALGCATDGDVTIGDAEGNGQAYP